MFLYPSDFDRGALQISGSDRIRFLSGMLSADIKYAYESAVSQGSATTGLSFFLNNKGRGITEILYLCDPSEDTLWLSCPLEDLELFHESLERYIIADDVEIKRIEAFPYRCFQIPDFDKTASNNAAEIEVTSKHPDAKDKIYFANKLSKTNGLEALNGYLLPRRRLSQSHMELWLSPESLNDIPPSWELSNDHDAFKKIRIAAGLPLWKKDYHSESFLLEFPILEGLSFHKGCYIGQEVIARTTYRGRVVRACCYVESADQHFLNTGDGLCLKSQPDKLVGKVLSSSGKSALALIRVEAIESQLAKNDQLFTKEPSVNISELRALIDLKTTSTP